MCMLKRKNNSPIKFINCAISTHPQLINDMVNNNGFPRARCPRNVQAATDAIVKLITDEILQFCTFFISPYETIWFRCVQTSLGRQIGFGCQEVVKEKVT